jgi:hypothetical protein
MHGVGNQLPVSGGVPKWAQMMHNRQAVPRPRASASVELWEGRPPISSSRARPAAAFGTSSARSHAMTAASSTTRSRGAALRTGRCPGRPPSSSGGSAAVSDTTAATGLGPGQSGSDPVPEGRLWSGALFEAMQDGRQQRMSDRLTLAELMKLCCRKPLGMAITCFTGE